MKLRSRSRRGAAAILVAFLLVAVVGAGALVVDVGHQRPVGAQLRAAADAAAVAGSGKLSESPAAARAAAIHMAGLNTAGGAPVVLANSDIVIGSWDSATQTFTALSGAAEAGGNAVQVHASNPNVPTFLAKVFGVDSVSVSRSATAVTAGGSVAYCGVLASQLPIINGSWSIDSYDSTVRAWSASTAGESGAVCSNANLTAQGGATIHGSLLHGTDPGDAASVSSTVTVTGTVGPLPHELTMPNTNSSAARTTNNNRSIGRTSSGKSPMDGSVFKLEGSDTLTLTAGTYYFTGLNIDNSAKLSTSGNVVIYVAGDLNVNGRGIANTSQSPGNLTIYVDGTKNVQLNGSSDFYGSILASNSELHHNGAADYFGVLVGKKIELNGGARFHEDLAMVNQRVGTVAGNRRVALRQ